MILINHSPPYPPVPLARGPTSDKFRAVQTPEPMERSPPPDNAPQDGDSPTVSARPRVIGGRYAVVRGLGEGAAGRTFLCNDLEGGRRVAVKELRMEHVGSWKHLELFEREARVLTLLEHPAIPQIFDSFREGSDSTAFYIAQEYVEGRSLQDRIDAGPMLGQEDVEEVARQMLHVLDYLHRRAPPVLHRDIKPANILLRDDGSVALIDFGGVLLEWRDPDSLGATVVGTFGYMPPEQLIGQAGTHSDLYALGATLLHALTGRSPRDFSFDSGRIEVPANLPATGLVRLIEALLRPAPRDRPGSATAALELLSARPAARVDETAPDANSGTEAPGGALVRRPTRAVASGVAHAPDGVDLGPPPRDVDGPFRDVYRNLVNPLFPSKRLWGAGMHVFWLGLATAGSIASVGILPYLYLRSVKRRIRSYGDLFRVGVQAEGVIRSVKDKGVYVGVKYEFVVGDQMYVAVMDYAAEMAEFWNAGDPVPVLYDASDPRRSCFVYR